MRSRITGNRPRSQRPLFGPALMLLATAYVAGCTRPVSVESGWGEGVARNQTFTKVLVVGVSPDFNQRCGFERSLAAELRSDAVQATASCAVMNMKDPLTRESVEGVVASLGADAVVATRLVALSAKAKEGGSADARGGGYYKATDIGYGYGTDYWGAYGMPGTVVELEFQTAPSVFSIEGTVHISTNVYETRGASIVYSLDTKAKNLKSREVALTQISPAIADRLRRDGLIG